MEKILSVSIAAYNVESTLREALNPFTAADVRDRVDVMIINDGSKDHTAGIAAEYQNQYPDTFRLITKENGGWGSTLNVGMRQARGKYFKQLDGDDYFSPENLPDFLDFLEKTDADWIHSPYVTFQDGDGAVIRKYGGLDSGPYRFFPIGPSVNIDYCKDYILSMHAATVKTAVLQRNDITILEHCFYTDIEFVIKSFIGCRTIAFYEKPVYFYRLARDGQSMSRKGVQKHYREHQKMLTHTLQFLDGKRMSSTIAYIVENRLRHVCNMQYIFYFALDCTREQRQELIAFDTWLREHAPDYYQWLDGRQIRLLRRTGFRGYKLIAAHKMAKDKRLRQNIFEGGA